MNDKVVRETKNFIQSESKIHGVEVDKLMDMVEKEIEEDDNGR